jgi:uncharacterized protein
MKESDIKELAVNGFFNNKPLKGNIVETHISWVILTRKYAFKIKKPLKLSFLDFSTLTLRKKYCERELALNSRFSDIYLSVLPVCLQKDVWTIGNSGGQLVDYAVVMKRMASVKRMDNLLRHNKVDNALMEALASKIVSFHKKAKKIFIPYDPSVLCNIFNDIYANRDFVLKQLGHPFAKIIDQSILWSDNFLAAHAHRIEQRIEQGFKRDVHGDLHSGNIFLYKKPVLFDCIEFNDAFRQIDIMDEIAFLCMDLDAFQHTQLGEYFLSAYKSKIACFEVAEDDALFIYFKCLRANIRAKVHILSAINARTNKELRTQLAETRNYLSLMKAYVGSL